MEQIPFSWLGQVLAAGGGGALVAYLVFKWLGTRWIENKFARNLEGLRQQHAKEFAELKVRWDANLHSRLKYQEREFVAVGDSWRLLQEAISLVEWGTSILQQYADIQRLDERELNEFLDGTEFSESQKTQLRERDGRQRQDHYTELVNRHRLVRVEAGIRNFSNYINENFPFIPEQMFSEFETLSTVMWGCMNKVRVGREANDFKLVREAYTETNENLRPQFEAIKVRVRAYMREIRGVVSEGRLPT